MISAYEMEKMASATKESFGGSSYDAVSADAWLNAQRRKLERQKRRAKAFQYAKQMVINWFHSFQIQDTVGV